MPNWFDKQLRNRLESDQKAFFDSFESISEVIMGRSERIAKIEDERLKTKDAIEEILKYYRVKPREIPKKIKDLEDQLEYFMDPAGIMHREVELKGKWYADAVGAMLGTTKDGKVIALIPSKFTGYEYFDREKGKKIRVNSKTAKNISEEAMCFYKPLPLKSLKIRDLVLYTIQSLSVPDFALLLIATLAVTLVGLISPAITKYIYSDVIYSQSINLLVSVFVLLVGVSISSSLISITKTLVVSRIQGRIYLSVEAAAMMRMISMPAGFFKSYSSGELASRIQNINSLCTMIADSLLTTGLTSLFSLIYIGQIFAYAPALTIPAFSIIIVTLAFSTFSSLMQMRISKRRMEIGAKESGLVYSLISGVQKIKLSGSECRAFAKWISTYKKRAKLQYDPPMMIKVNTVISTAISLIGTLVLYYCALNANIGVANYMAFIASNSMVSGAFASLAGIALTAANIKPIFDMVAPILKSEPEVSEGKHMVTSVSGNIEINNLSFKYSEDMPIVIDDLSLKIKSGEYVAIVGRTGCGKSTLMRLLLGFEKPQKGAVYYDGRDLNTLDLKSLRKKIGSVMQNGKLFQGDIFSNITISAPQITLKEAWEVAETCGIDEDIKSMPMGMYTVISEGSGGVSGGQKQRLMIARAIAPKPKILIFDEATSALDNLTQKKVSESLDSLKCTRIIIAHRLSTIKNCDRILVFDKGKIAEEGKYDDLIEKGGLFSDLVKRQML